MIRSEKSSFLTLRIPIFSGIIIGENSKKTSYFQSMDVCNLSIFPKIEPPQISVGPILLENIKWNIVLILLSQLFHNTENNCRK